MLLAGIAVALAASLTPAAACAAPASGVGAPGVGDPFFPLAGNGGYDVTRYQLRLDYRPASGVLRGRTSVTATAEQALTQFDLDLRGFTVEQVVVDGLAATWWRSGQELVVVPAAPLAEGAAFSVVVRYAGKPRVIIDPDKGIGGWVATPDGAFVVGEPQGSPGWYAVDDDPADKATFDFTVTVPRGLTVLCNGVLVSRTRHGGRVAWRWREDDPMAPYLATATLGRFDLECSSVLGVPSYVAVDSDMGRLAVLSKLPAIIRYYSSVFGAYPFHAVGAVVDNAPQVGYALETQTKPVFDSIPDEATLAHELAHQWFGDSVTLAQWSDIWLNEGFATWAEWAWVAHAGGRSLQRTFDRVYATPADRAWLWRVPPAAPVTPADLFGDAEYERGALCLEALRQKAGDAVFFSILRAWAQDHRYGNVTTPEFIALAEQQSGTDLGAFFQAWLYTSGKPASW
jgi:aminopeptidase N